MNVTIDRFSAAEYRLPRSTQPIAPANFLVRIVGEVDGHHAVGVGECTPRGQGTGDDSASWDFLQDAANTLCHSSLMADDDQQAIDAVRGAVKDLRGLAEQWGGNSLGHRRFHGTILGIEMALLDLVATARETSVAELLGSPKPEIRVTKPSLTVGGDTSTLLTKYQRRLSHKEPVRLRMSDDISSDLKVLRKLARADSTASWWLEYRGELTPSQAKTLLQKITKGMRSGTFPNEVIIEQPLPGHMRNEMADLQRRVDEILADGEEFDLRIMADESLSSADSLSALQRQGGCRALNVKAARLGGTLAALELIAAAVDSNPDVRVALSTMANASDVNRWSTYHLAAAMPNVDFVTAAPSHPEDTRISDHRPAFERNGQRAIALPRGNGLGIEVSFTDVLPLTERYAFAPDARGPVLAGRPANRYDEERPTRDFTKSAMRSHMVEREALALGLSTIRYGPEVFLAQQGNSAPLIFGASARSSVSSASSFVICDQHKGAAQAILERAGIPVPVSRVFSRKEISASIAFAERIGYPVVTKPASGTGGKGVSTNLADAEAVRGGFAAIQETARFKHNDVLLQEHIAGQIYRIVVQDGAVTAVIHRERASVTGDGRRSVAELIIEKNTYRVENPRLGKYPIDGPASAAYLADQERSLESVPDADERVFLGDVADPAAGGDTLDVIDETHPSILDAAVRAVAAVPDLHFCGIDILLEDHRRPIDEQGAGICELNACPGLVLQRYPLFGVPQNSGRKLVRMAAQAKGLELADAPATQLAVNITVTGEIGAEYGTWLARKASSLGLNGALRHVSQSELMGVLIGDLIPVSTLVSAAIGGPRKSRPVKVMTTHTNSPQEDGLSLTRQGGVSIS